MVPLASTPLSLLQPLIFQQTFSQRTGMAPLLKNEKEIKTSS
jgi:hypothetical protein